MIHVICSKWGTKYSSVYVNTLYEMVKRYLPVSFKFYCQTEDTDGLNTKIEVLPFGTKLPESTPQAMVESTDYLNDLPRLWDRPKLNYFDPDCWGLKGTKMAFDIDILIHNDMTPIIDAFWASDKPLTARSWWHNMDYEARPQWRKRYGARNNGGFYMWEGDMFQPIWDDLLKNWRKIYFCFHGGSDNFISTRHLDEFEFLSSDHYYSFNRGCKWPDDIARHIIREEKIICAFNTDQYDESNVELHDAIKLYPKVKELWM